MTKDFLKNEKHLVKHIFLSQNIRQRVLEMILGSYVICGSESWTEKLIIAKIIRGKRRFVKYAKMTNKKCL